MEQLIFFAVLIFFSIIESIARSRKQRQGGAPAESPPEPEREVEAQRQRQPRRAPTQRPRPSIPPSYDEDASFDARVPAEEGRSLEAEISYDQASAAEAERRRREASSESMIPSDIWEEISGLAREAKVELPKPQPRLPQPRPSHVPRPGRPAAPKPPLRRGPPAPPARATRVSRRPDVEGTESHPVHRSHVGYGTDPSERAPSAQDAQPSTSTANADAAAVRLQLRSKKAHALRQALILQEILGPPAAIKPHRSDD